jgi:TctA family transporter
MGSGDWTIFFTRPVALILFVLTIGCLLWPALQMLRRRPPAVERGA